MTKLLQMLRVSQRGATAIEYGLIAALIAVAAIAAQADHAGLGIDVELAEPLPPNVLDVVASSAEQAQLAKGPPHQGRVLFAIKEAVYKAVGPLTGRFLDFPDVAVDLATGLAHVTGGPLVEVRWCDEPRIVALAVIPRRGPP